MQRQAPWSLGSDTGANQSYKRTYLRSIIDRQEMTSFFKTPILSPPLRLHNTLELV